MQLFYVLSLTLSLEIALASVQTFEKPDKYSIRDKQTADFPFRNPDLPINERLNDLVSRLTLDELVLQLARGGAQLNGPAPAIDRLGIKPYNWNTECLRGYGLNGDATCYPSPIGLAATFDESLIHDMAQVIALEARAKHNYFNANNKYGDHTGLSCFSPVINIMRHPLWGRNQETYGEDPVLTSTMAHAYVTGLESGDIVGGIQTKFPGATSVCKHFGVHSGPENIPESRFSFNAEVSDHDLGNTFLLAFRECTKAGANGVMCSYNAINGVPACANKFMITDLLRNTFDFSGYVISDEGAMEHIHQFFHYTKDSLHSGVAAISAGVDSDLTYYGKYNSFSLLGQAVDQKLVNLSEIQTSAKRLFKNRMVLGEFDPPGTNPWLNVTTDVIHSHDPTNTAADTFVLLKNDGILPLKASSFDKVSMVGPFGNNPDALTGDYYTEYDLKYFSSPFDAAKSFSRKDAKLASGCSGDWNTNLPKCVDYDWLSVHDTIDGSDLVFITLGTGRGVEAESNDRANMSLPGYQTQLLHEAVQFAKGAPVVLLIFSAGPLNITWAVEKKGVNAIVQCHFPAQSTGNALKKVLQGMEGYSPSGRLPYTWYKTMDQVRPMTNYSMEERTYKYFTGTPLFPFGYGLSYGQFKYNTIHVTPSAMQTCPEKISVTVTVSATRNCNEVIQIYWKPKGSSDNPKLIGFKKSELKTGNQTVTVEIKAFALSVWQKDPNSSASNYFILPGKYTVFAGGQQPNQTVSTGSNVLQTSFEYDGPLVLLDNCAK